MAHRPSYRRIPARSRPFPPARRRRPRRWWVLAAVALGLLGYLGYWLVKDQVATPPPVTSSAGSKPKPMEAKAPAQTKPKSPVSELPAKEPRFTFYTLLPEKELIIPEGEVRARKRAEILGRSKPEDYFIQVGSFHSPEDAKRLQAELGRLGIKARLEQTEIGKVLWYRVRVGPFKTLREVETIRARLRANRIDSVVQTVKR